MQIDPVENWTGFASAVERLKSEGRKDDLAQLLERGIEQLERARGKFIGGRPVTFVIADLDKELAANDPTAASRKAQREAATAKEQAAAREAASKLAAERLEFKVQPWLREVVRLEEAREWKQLADALRKGLRVIDGEPLLKAITHIAWQKLLVVSRDHLRDEVEAKRARAAIERIDADFRAAFEAKAEALRARDDDAAANELAKLLVDESTRLRASGDVARMVAALKELGALYRDRLDDRALAFLAYLCAFDVRRDDEGTLTAIQQLRATARPTGIDPRTDYARLRESLALFFDWSRLEEAEAQLPAFERTIRDAIEYLIAFAETPELLDKLYTDLAFSFGRQGKGDGVIGELFEHFLAKPP